MIVSALCGIASLILLLRGANSGARFLAIGAVAGNRLGHGLTTLYAEFFSFPFLIFRESPDLYLVAGGVTVASGLAGAFQSIRRIVALPPAITDEPVAAR